MTELPSEITPPYEPVRTGEVTAEDYIAALHRHMRDRDEWCDHLAGRESALLLAVPRPFRMVIHRRAERIQREAQ